MKNYKIDKTNYFKATWGDFELFKELQDKVDNLKGNETGKLRKIYKDFEKQNKDWKLDHISKNKYTNWIASIYFTNDKTNQLIRISNHWGGGIASCCWDVIGFKNTICKKTKWMAGIINFNDFKLDEEMFKIYNF